MKKTRITRKDARGDIATFAAGYCELYALLRFRSPFGYNCGVYGWNFDSYEIDGVVINTGYRGMPGQRIPFELAEKYEKSARACLLSDLSKPREQLKDETEKILNDFITEIKQLKR